MPHERSLLVGFSNGLVVDLTNRKGALAIEPVRRLHRAGLVLYLSLEAVYERLGQSKDRGPYNQGSKCGWDRAAHASCYVQN